MMFVNKFTLAVLISSPLLTNAQETTLNRDSINKIRAAVSKEVLAPALKDTNTMPNWEFILSNAKRKYGVLGEEKVYGAQMVHYLEKKDWDNFGKYYALYYKTAYSRSEYHINNLSWKIFKNITDTEVLAIAVNAAKFSMDNFSKEDPIDIDTYANLLYKLGRKQEAIKWESKAVQLSNYGKEFVETLDKMKKGEPTWN